MSDEDIDFGAGMTPDEIEWIVSADSIDKVLERWGRTLMRQRDEARAEVMSLTRQRDAALAWASWWKFSARSRYSWREMEDIRDTDIQDTNQALAEVERLRRGIKAYREVLASYKDTPRTGHTGCLCAVCEWEREDKKRIDECGDER